MRDVGIQCREYAEGNQAAAAIVIGFGGNTQEFEPAALALLERGYDAYVYSYDPSCLLEGDPTLMPILTRDIGTDFERRAQEALMRRYIGNSLGAAIAWNNQKTNADSRIKIEPGLYSSAGTDVARLIMRNHVFQELIKRFHKRDIKRAYTKNGFTEEDVRAHWAELQVPPTNGFVLANSDADPIIPAWQIRPLVRKWKGEGVSLRTRTFHHLGHTGMKSWLINNIPEMLRLSEML